MKEKIAVALPKAILMNGFFGTVGKKKTSRRAFQALIF